MASAGRRSCCATALSYKVSDLAEDVMMEGCPTLSLQRPVAQAACDHPEGLCRDLVDVVTYSSSGFHSSGWKSGF